MNKFSVETRDGIPALFQDGIPEIPVLYWMRELNEKDLTDIHAAGIRLLTCYWARTAMAHPFWVGESQYDFSWFDGQMDL